MLELFSTREIATGIYIVLILIYALWNSQVRKSLFDVIKCALSPKLALPTLTMCAFGGFIGYRASRFAFWDNAYYKDIIMWIILVGLPLCFGAISSKEESYFKNAVIDNLKLTVLFELLFSTFTFSLWVYGSKKVYKKYILFREFTSNPLIQKSKYNIDGLLVYVIGDILKSIRHEVGLTSIGDLTTNEALSFIVNNFAMNPLQKIKTYKAKYCIFMIRVELFMHDRINFVYVKKGYYYLIKPAIGVVWLTLRFLVLYPIIKLEEALSKSKIIAEILETLEVD